MNPKLPVITSKQLLSALQKAGFIIHRRKGSHISLKHPGPPIRIVFLPFHNVDMKKGTLKSALRQAGLTVNQLIELL